VYKFDGDMLVETPFMMRDVANEGHPGAMLSLSANGNRDGILWAAIHSTGDSWHESRPGILHAFEADDIRHELWNSLEIPKRDDCGEYSKMAPPTIANGRVYLASFGDENTGTGQFCVYGELPAHNAPELSAPLAVAVSVEPNGLKLSWASVPGARYYRILRTSSHQPEEKIVAMGLTTESYTEPAPEKGESSSYAVVAVAANGRVSAKSRTVTFASPNVMRMEN